ncbi:MAG: acetyl-CoA hydrolase [Spirochaetes bacterium GWD1_61_31]|nr:MAG: acetyl-CoA hydrolase [Spirochaetes bacterium GWB1_60_80]OHD38529.1 MAG: acetyl-CoA hydrolase [Spirochaetes bacterium GWD1_61_31]OHD43046.1 MAG: acetyl-CoA hydrolase [Spirochaetes bacterium GWE1_60_18]OHD59642.1 MAG: acetyl-CoA hydrolase [Spirochaetes bacterium GWF1_60_12]HAP44136.1 4-hydroxybutyrate--acetyl-CoA CoA transferase [Spirochaetaceae bacterium]
MNRHESEYRNKLRSVDEAIACIQSSYDVVVGQCASEPQGCMARLHSLAPRVRDVRVFSVLTLNPYDFYMKPEMRGHFELASWFHAPGSRAAIKAGAGTVSFVPNMLHRAATDRLHARPPEVFIGTCTPPDKHGFVSLSLGITYEKDILEAAKYVILEVNPRLPRTFGDTQLHISQATWFVEHEQEVPSLPSPQPSATDQLIGEHIAGLVDDGSTIQLGIGGIPNAAALALRHKKDLGVHTEMLVDSMMELYEQGVITNRRKSFKKDKFIATFAMGSRKLYDWLDDNVVVEFQRGRWVNDPAVVAQNSKMVSINTCLMVDFTGQVASESIGSAQYSGTGGQSDTAQGAVAGFDGLGKSIIACYAKAKGDTVSTIVPVLPLGSAVSLHRAFVDHIVTEYGVAKLRGRTIKERTQALIQIAAPEFRAELMAEAKKLGYL